MLRKIRTILAAVFIVLITLLFLDFTGTLHHWLGWMAKIQFLPAVMALNVVVVVALIALTLVFGRIYCSVHLSVRRISGYPGSVPSEEEQVQLFQRGNVAALSCIGCVCRCRCSWCRFAVPVTRSL